MPSTPFTASSGRSFTANTPCCPSSERVLACGFAPGAHAVVGSRFRRTRAGHAIYKVFVSSHAESFIAGHRILRHATAFSSRRRGHEGHEPSGQGSWSNPFACPPYDAAGRRPAVVSPLVQHCVDSRQRAGPVGPDLLCRAALIRATHQR
jgi:hypothetical protein